MSKTNHVLKKCDQCQADVVISYVCPRCQQRTCMLCAMAHKWACPTCHTPLL